MTYKRRASPLHATRAAVGALWCLALVTLALSAPHPAVLGALLAAVVCAALGARVARPVLAGVALAVPFGVVVALVNALATRDGLTVIYRLGGPFDVTLEGLVQGAVYGLLAVVLLAVAWLYSAAVDPDDLLRSLRRLSFSSALTAVLATRLVPVLARDGRRLAEAQRCRAGQPASRLVLVRAVASGALDRALDVAATLEVRGYGTAGRTPALRRPWSRHDVAFTVSALALFALAAIGHRLASFDAYPRLDVPLDGGVAWSASLIAVAALAPFAQRRGT